MDLQAARTSVTIGLDRGHGGEHAVDSESDIHRGAADRAFCGNECESTDAGEKSRGHIDATDPAMHGGIARADRPDELDTAERENDAARGEMHADAGCRRRCVAFIQTRQALVPLGDVSVDERGGVEREDVQPEKRGADPASRRERACSPPDRSCAHRRRSEGCVQRGAYHVRKGSSKPRPLSTSAMETGALARH